MKRATLAAFFEFSSRAAAGLVLAAPVTAAVAATGIGAFPEGDRLLFEPGGLLLVEAVRSSFSLLAPLTTAALATAAFFSVALTLPQALLWTAVAEETPEPLATFIGRAGLRIPSLVALTGLGFLSQVLACALGLASASFLRDSAANPLVGDLWALGVVGLSGLVALALGVVRDVSSAAVACGANDARRALRLGLAAVIRAPGAALARWLGPATLGLALIAVAAAAAGAIDVSRPGTPRLVAVLALHQSVVLGLSFCRAAWFGAAVRLVRPQLDAGSAARR